MTWVKTRGYTSYPDSFDGYEVVLTGTGNDAGKYCCQKEENGVTNYYITDGYIGNLVEGFTRGSGLVNDEVYYEGSMYLDDIHRTLTGTEYTTCAMYKVDDQWILKPYEGRNRVGLKPYSWKDENGVAYGDGWYDVTFEDGKAKCVGAGTLEGYPNLEYKYGSPRRWKRDSDKSKNSTAPCGVYADENGSAQDLLIGNPYYQYPENGTANNSIFFTRSSQPDFYQYSEGLMKFRILGDFPHFEYYDTGKHSLPPIRYYDNDYSGSLKGFYLSVRQLLTTMRPSLSSGNLTVKLKFGERNVEYSIHLNSLQQKLTFGKADGEGSQSFAFQDYFSSYGNSTVIDNGDLIIKIDGEKWICDGGAFVLARCTTTETIQIHSAGIPTSPYGWYETSITSYDQDITLKHRINTCTGFNMPIESVLRKSMGFDYIGTSENKSIYGIFDESLIAKSIGGFGCEQSVLEGISIHGTEVTEKESKRTIDCNLYQILYKSGYSYSISNGKIIVTKTGIKYEAEIPSGNISLSVKLFSSGGIINFNESATCKFKGLRVSDEKTNILIGETLTWD